MRRIPLFCILAIPFLLPASAFAAAQIIPFDRAYTVSEVGSTTPQSMFSIKGSAPVLYLDLPSAMGQYSYGSSTWFAGSQGSSLFSVSSPGTFASEGEYWLTPTPEVWNSVKRVGDWRVNANYGWWDLVIIYGGGAPLTRAQGSVAIDFKVLAGKGRQDPAVSFDAVMRSAAVPEPAGPLAIAVLAAFGISRRSRSIAAAV